MAASSSLLADGGHIQGPTPCAAKRDRSALISALSNLGIQYNFQSIAIALLMMDQEPAATTVAPPAPPGANLPPPSPPPYVAPYPRTADQESLLKSLVFAGAIAGQLCMGYAGDVWGRRNAMLLTNLLTFVGAAGSALFTWGEPTTLYTVLMVCRFVIGVGVGGKYPLAATMRSEACEDGQSGGGGSGGGNGGGAGAAHSATEVAKGFFWQTPGAMLPYVVALCVLSGLGHSDDDEMARSIVSVQFRVVLGLGALPAFCVMVLCYFQPESEAYTEARAAGSGDGLSTNPIAVASRHPEHWRRLVGTGLSWLLYDFVYYGTALNQPQILGAVLPADGVYANCLQNIAVTAMGLPGVVCAIAMLRWLGSKQLQAWGFVAISGVSVAFALTLAFARDSEAASFALFTVLSFVLAWGCNVSTYVLPTEVFPSQLRSSFFGLSAGMGKVGALLGGATFVPIADSSAAYGYTEVFLACAAVALLGLLITHAFVEPYRRETLCGCGARARSAQSPIEPALLQDAR